MEEGEIPVATEVTVIVLDLKEETPATADLAEAGQVAIAKSPPAPAEPKTEKVPPAAEGGEAAAKSPRARARRSGEHRAEQGSSSRRLAHRPVQWPPEEPMGGSARPMLKLRTMEDDGWAAILLSKAQTPAIDEEMGRQSYATLLDMVMVNVLQLANEAFAIRATAAHTGEALALTVKRADKYKEQARTLSEKLAWQQEEAKAREEDLGGRAREAERRAEVKSGQASMAITQLTLVSSRLDSARAEIEELHRQLQHAEDRVEAVAGEVQAALERAAAAEAKAVDARHKRAGAEAHAHEARARAKEAENKAWEAEARASAETQAREVEAKADARIREIQAEAAAWIQEAEARVTNAIADLKASKKFKQEVLEASLDAYKTGFEFCKEKLSAAFNISSFDLEKIWPDGPGGEETAEEEEAGEEQGPPEP